MKRIIYVTSIIFLSVFSIAAMSQDIAAMKKMTQKQFMSTCDDAGFLKCIGIDKSKCISSTKKTLSSCDQLFPKNADSMDEGMTAFGECFSKNIIKFAGISEEKLDACEPTENQPPMDMQQGLAMFNQAMQQQAQMMGTDGVTLPIYENTTVMSHLSGSQGAQIVYNLTGEMHDGTLPALTLASPDDSSKIVAYYQKKLNGFSKIKVDDGVLFIKSKQKDFDPLRDMKVYATTPHVMVSPMGALPGIPANTKSKIEIAYKK